MHQPLIFTERRLLPRIIDSLLTLIAWGGFLWLIYGGVIKAVIDHPGMGPRPFTSTLATLSLYFVVSASYGGLLILWARYNQHRFRVERRSRKPGLANEEVAKSFHITPGQVDELHTARLLTVHHNRYGDISSVAQHLGIATNVLTLTRTA